MHVLHCSILSQYWILWVNYGNNTIVNMLAVCMVHVLLSFYVLIAWWLTLLQDLNVTVRFYILLCNERPSPNFYWQLCIFLYLAALQIIGILLAFQTRRVKLHGLRDSKFIAAIIYISSVVLVVLALVIFALRVYINIGAGIYATGVLLLTTIFLILIFIPKVQSVTCKGLCFAT